MGATTFFLLELEKQEQEQNKTNLEVMSIETSETSEGTKNADIKTNIDENEEIKSEVTKLVGEVKNNQDKRVIKTRKGESNGKRT